MQHRFSRLEKIMGKENLTNLSKKKVLVLGCGGVGGYVIESLARSGIGSLVIVDYDTVDITNINRQIIALDSTIGKNKVDLLEERIKEINPKCKVKKIKDFIDDKNIDQILDPKLDYVVDACDTILTKKEVLKKCIEKKIPMISSMGTGNKLVPSKLEIVELQKTKNDPLARIMRKYVKDEKINKKIMVLSSKELPIKTGERTPGSSVFVPASAGLLIASYLVRELIKKNDK